MGLRGRKRTGESGNRITHPDRRVRFRVRTLDQPQKGARRRSRVGSTVAGMSGRARYAAILRTPHVAPLLGASMLARLPYGMFALALVLYMVEARGSYAVAGLVDGAFGIGAAIGSPLQ